jgi:D-alanyl-D-alanine carboxypeptidase
MRELIDEHIVTASARRTAPVIVEAAENTVQIAAPRLRADTAPAPARIVDADTPPPAASVVATRAEPVSSGTLPSAPDASDELKPIPVKTVKVKASTLQTAAIGSVAAAAMPASPPAAAPQPVPAPVQTIVASAPPPPAMIADPVAPPAPTRTASIATRPEPAEAPVEPARSTPPQPARSVSVEPAARTSSPQRAAHAGWLIQVGALETIEAANDRIAAARGKAMNILGHADAFTEPVVKGDKTLHRARFAGFDKDRAEAACKALKRADIVCMTIRN